MKIYKVLDVVVNNDTKQCIIHAKDDKWHHVTIAVNAVYEVIIGCESRKIDVESEVRSMLSYRLSDVVTNTMSNKRTYLRGLRNLVAVRCKDYNTYNSVIKSVTYYERQKLFICDRHSTVEDVTMRGLGIYGCSYIVLKDGKLYATRQDKTSSPYKPIVSAIDLEMLDLDGVDPDCEVYMASFVLGNISHVIYTNSYLKQDIPDTEFFKYIRVTTKEDLVLKLIDLIIEYKVDVVLGYNIYFADVPLLYYTISRKLIKLKKSAIDTRPFFHDTRKIDKNFVESESGKAIKIPGVNMIDMYPYLNSLLPSEEKTSMKLGDVCHKYLGEGKDDLDYKTLTWIYYRGTIEDKMKAMKYCAKDSELCIKLYEYFNVWNYHSALYELSGINAQRIMSHGSTTVAYGMFNTRALEMKVYMDDPNNRIYKPGGGLCLPPISGTYRDVLCIDLNSLYPNLVVQHCIDPLNKLSDTEVRALLGSNVIYVKHIYYSTYKTDPEIQMLRDSFGNYHCFRKNNNDSIVPHVLENLLNKRLEIKAQIQEAKKDNKDDVVKQLEGVEKSIKETANSVVGGWAQASPGNPLSNCVLNDIVTTSGKAILNHASRLAPLYGVTCIYGDTDSLMLYPQDRGRFLLEEIHKVLPTRIRFKVEYVADIFIMGVKKHYVARINGKTKIVGYKASKSSVSRVAQSLFRRCVEVLLDNGPQNSLLYYESEVEKILSRDTLDYDDLAINFYVRGKDYSTRAGVYKKVGALKSRGVAIIPGNTLRMLMVYTLEEYRDIYNREPPIRLPNDSEGVSVRYYTVEEVVGYSEVVNIRLSLYKQCGSVLKNLIEKSTSNLGVQM